MIVLRDDLRRAIESALSEELRAIDAVGGGDVCQAFRLTLSSGQTVFAKVHDGAPAGMFESEAHGLSMLGLGPLRVPAVLCHDDRFLLLEDLGVATPGVHHDEALGRGLALIHQQRAELAGCDERRSGYIATLSIDNTPAEWATFYLRRLQHLITSARLDAARVARFDASSIRVRSLLADAPVALLHGDLWRGNVHTDESGSPCLVDPSAYYGDPEVDLAMMHLFGGFSTSVFDAYDEALPPRPGRGSRRSAYQLYPVLVHLVLFGATYLTQLDRLLDRLE